MSQLNDPLCRLHTDSEKYDCRKQVFGTEDVLPMWVADMDLPTPPFIIEALQQRLTHPILGYTQTPDRVYQSIIDWQAQHLYAVKASHIIFTHNVANGFFMAVNAFTRPGHSVLVLPPIYPPFLSAAKQHQRNLVESPLQLHNNRYEIDFVAFEKAIILNNVKLFLFCHPQNPSGRVWLKEELIQLANICIKHQVIIVSDEIHSDLVTPNKTHIPLASLSDKIAQQVITLNSPGKTFNLGGCQIGYAIIANPQLKADYLKVCQQNAIDSLNLFGQTALVAAYSPEGLKWCNRLLLHFSQNIQRLQDFLATEFPKVKIMIPEASYLVWLDFSALFKDHSQLKKWLVEEAKLGLNDGESFGGASKVGSGFMRMNIAVPDATLTLALQQLKAAKPSLEKFTN